jgi:hypothetical protein
MIARHSEYISGRAQSTIIRASLIAVAQTLEELLTVPLGSAADPGSPHKGRHPADASCAGLLRTVRGPSLVLGDVVARHEFGRQ